MVSASFTHTTGDGVATSVSYSVDSDGCLVRKTTVVQNGAHVDPKSDKVTIEAQSPGKDALAQLAAYKVNCDDCFSNSLTNHNWLCQHMFVTW